jgi:hypothetical protein
MIKFRHYADSAGLGIRYAFGLNIYRNLDGTPTIDLILGKHVFVLFWVKK